MSQPEYKLVREALNGIDEALRLKSTPSVKAHLIHARNKLLAAIDYDEDERPAVDD